MRLLRDQAPAGAEARLVEEEVVEQDLDPVAGEPDPITGFVVDLKWLKDVIEEKIMAAWDHRHLNLEVPEFAATIPTSENIAIAAWRRIEPAIAAAGGARLAAVRVYETPEIFAEYRGER